MSAFSVLSRMGVPGANNERAPVLQPILNHKFQVVFFGLGGPQSDPIPYDLTRQMQSIGLPSIATTKSTINSYVSEIYLPVYTKFGGAIQVSFLDDITNSVAELLYSSMYRQHNFFDVTHTRAAENPKFDMDINILAGGASASDATSDPNILRKFCLSGCFIESLTEGNMAYGTQTPKTLNANISFDVSLVFDHNGNRMARDVSHSNEINGQLGRLSTGIGGSANTNINGAGVSIGATAGISVTGGVSF